MSFSCIVGFPADGGLCLYLAVVFGYALNIMIGIQVLLGALTTAISAAVRTVRQASLIPHL